MVPYSSLIGVLIKIGERPQGYMHAYDVQQCESQRDWLQEKPNLLTPQFWTFSLQNSFLLGSFFLFVCFFLPCFVFILCYCCYWIPGIFSNRERKEGCRFRWVGRCGGSERSWGRRNSYKNVLYEQKNQFSIKKYNIHGAKNWPVPAIFLSPKVQYSTWWRDHHLLPVTGIHLPNDRTAADVIATDVLKG